MCTIFKCDQCEYASNGWMGLGNYVITDTGEHVLCNGQPELINEMIQRLIEMPYFEADKAGRIGECEARKCLDCDAITWLDKLDEVRCIKCRSENILRIEDIVDKTCPKCGRGTIRGLLLLFDRA